MFHARLLQSMYIRAIVSWWGMKCDDISFWELFKRTYGNDKEPQVPTDKSAGKVITGFFYITIYSHLIYPLVNKPYFCFLSNIFGVTFCTQPEYREILLLRER
jgi:hypothetical protein